MVILIFSDLHTPTGTPALTFCIATIVGVNLNLLVYNDYDRVYLFLVDIADLSCCFIFLNAFIAYLFFKWKYSSMPRFLSVR